MRKWKDCLPVGDWKQVILKVSASIVSTPELPAMGLIRLAIAWILWKVLARTRYSFEVSWESPSAEQVGCGIRHWPVIGVYLTGVTHHCRFARISVRLLCWWSTAQRSFEMTCCCERDRACWYRYHVIEVDKFEQLLWQSEDIGVDGRTVSERGTSCEDAQLGFVELLHLAPNPTIHGQQPCHKQRRWLVAVSTSFEPSSTPTTKVVLLISTPSRTKSLKNIKHLSCRDWSIS